MAVNHVDLKLYINVLSKYISPGRRQRMEKVASSRDDRVSIVLENVIDTGNENAVMRTMEGLGFHRLYRLRDDPCITSSQTISKLNRLQRTDSGARKWLLTHTSHNVEDCIHAIKQNGYQLVCAVPNAPQSIYDIELNEKTAFVFGNETNGVSRALQEVSELSYSLPMHGFVESYNVSVAAAITLYHAYTCLMHKTQDMHVTDMDILSLRYCIIHLGHEKANHILMRYGLKPITSCELGQTTSQNYSENEDLLLLQ